MSARYAAQLDLRRPAAVHRPELRADARKGRRNLKHPTTELSVS